MLLRFRKHANCSVSSLGMVRGAGQGELLMVRGKGKDAD